MRHTPPRAIGSRLRWARNQQRAVAGAAETCLALMNCIGLPVALLVPADGRLLFDLKPTDPLTITMARHF